MVKYIGLYSVLIMMSLFIINCSKQDDNDKSAENAKITETVTLTMGSWRSEDVEQMNVIISKFNETNPNIIIKYDPTLNTEYNEALEAQLAGGSGPDIFYLRSYATARILYDKGYLEILDDVPGIKKNFSADMLAPWMTDDGKSYGMPFIATSHGIYYNKDIFSKLNLSIPDTWDSFIATAKKIKQAGITPLANASNDRWTIAEIVFMNILPSFTGGRDERMLYLYGKKCFNDKDIVSVYQALKDISLYLPAGQQNLKYSDSLNLFSQGKAAMWMGGSWDIPYFEKEKLPFEWSVFAVPAPSSKKSAVTFQLDAGMGLNKASLRKKEALVFLKWMTTLEFAETMGNTLPGFFPMHNNPPSLKSVHANDFLQLNNGRKTDIRFTWEKLMEGSPSAYDLIMNDSYAVINGTMQPEKAADNLQQGLAKWYKPTMNCKK